MTRIAVIDFETTGMSPQAGARATEVGIALLEAGRVVDRFHSLMNAGVWVPAFIEQLTGITNAMLAGAPPAYAVMADAARFVGSVPMVAHNASFDRRFWQDELARAGLPADQPFACTVLLGRRIWPDAPRYSLGALAHWQGVESPGRAHRAMADAEVAALLLARMQRTLCRQFDLPDAPHALLMQLQRSPRAALPKVVQGFVTAATAP